MSLLPPSPGTIVFDYGQWVLAYPELAAVPAGQAQDFFNRATLVAVPVVTGEPATLVQRSILMNMATAHFAALFGTLGGQPPRGLVGRIGNAGEGSVHVQAEYMRPANDLQAFFNQTPYGAAFWAATQAYRSAFFLPPPPVNYGGGRPRVFRRL